MNFNEVKNVGTFFSDYLTYEGHNLWELNEAGLYNSFFINPSRKNAIHDGRDFLIHHIINLKRNCRSKRKFVKKSSKEEILIVPYDMSHANTFLRLLRDLKNVRIIRNDSPNSSITKDILDSNKLPFVNLDNFITIKTKRAVGAANKWLSKQFNLIKNDNGLKVKLGENYDQVIEVLKYCCKTRKLFLETILNIELFKEIYCKEKYKLVLVADDVNSVGRIAVRIANQYDVSSLTIQHGQLQGNPVGDISSDFMAVNGERDKEFLIKKGAPLSKIVVTGQPRFDSIFKNKYSHKKSCKELGLDYNKKIVMFTVQKPLAQGSVNLAALNCFFEAIRKIPDKENYEFIITMREDMSLKDLSSDYKSLGIKVMIGGDIHKILACCDVFTTAFSTVAIESALMGHPVITINLNNRNYINYTSEGVGYTVFKAKDFLPRLYEVLNDLQFKKKFSRSRKQFVKNYNFSDDGMSTKRQIKLIKDIIKKKI